MAGVLYVESKNLIIVDGLYDVENETFENAATIEVTLLDSSGSEVSGETWPTNATYETDSDGRYVAVIDSDVSISVGSSYVAKVQVKIESELTKTWWIDLDAKEDRRP